MIVQKPPPVPQPRLAAPPSPLSRWPDSAWTALAVAGITLALGLVSIGAGTPLLFPSLAPATMTHVANPRLKSAGLYNTIVGQLLGVGCGYFAVWATRAASAPAAFSAHSMPGVRVWAAVLGLFLTTLAQSGARAMNPPAGATVVLIALGAFAPAARDFWTLVGGVLLMAALGEPVRRAQLARLERLTPGRSGRG